MGFNFNNNLGKYICIHCKQDFDKLPKIKQNECPTSYEHFIVSKNKLKKIQEERIT
jgi:DNA-directed RNA polymerase subunit RPC12/RpoP